MLVHICVLVSPTPLQKKSLLTVAKLDTAGANCGWRYSKIALKIQWESVYRNVCHIKRNKISRMQMAWTFCESDYTFSYGWLQTALISWNNYKCVAQIVFGFSAIAKEIFCYLKSDTGWAQVWFFYLLKAHPAKKPVKCFWKANDRKNCQESPYTARSSSDP